MKGPLLKIRERCAFTTIHLHLICTLPNYYLDAGVNTEDHMVIPATHGSTAKMPGAVPESAYNLLPCVCPVYPVHAPRSSLDREVASIRQGVRY